MLHGVVGRDERGRSAVIETIAPLWDGNEVWLIVATAGTFAAFPGWYATMFSGFYPSCSLVLVALILRGVAFEFRSHAESDRGRRIWGAALAGGSLLVPFGLGIVLGGLLGGVPIDADQEFVGGLGDLLAPYALATGATLALLCLARAPPPLAAHRGAALHARARRAARVLAPSTALRGPRVLHLDAGRAGNGFLLSFIELIAVLAAIAAAVLVRGGREGAAFAATSATIAAVVVSLFSELYPRVMVSSLGAANDLTTQNTASASYALTVMTVVLAVLLPSSCSYQAWTYVVFRGRVRGRGSVTAARRRSSPRRAAPRSGPGLSRSPAARWSRHPQAGEPRDADREGGWSRGPHAGLGVAAVPAALRQTGPGVPASPRRLVAPPSTWAGVGRRLAASGSFDEDMVDAHVVDEACFLQTWGGVAWPCRLSGPTAATSPWRVPAARRHRRVPLPLVCPPPGRTSLESPCATRVPVAGGPASGTGSGRAEPMSADDLSQALSSLFVVALVAALAPLVVGLLARLRVPQVVVLIIGGIVIGPQVLGWADPASIGLLANVGLGFLFLLAGYELDLTLFREKAGRLALVGWPVTVVLAAAVVGLLKPPGWCGRSCRCRSP